MKYLLLLLMSVSLCACSVVGPGERGVRVSLGKVSAEPKQPGAYLWFPFLLGMSKIDVQIQKTDVQSESASKDMQEINADVVVNWSLSPTNVVKTYQEIGDEDDVAHRILVPAVNEVMKAASAKLTAEEVLTKRIDLKNDIDASLKTRLAQYGITVQDISITNLSFSKDFSAAIEEKQIAEQQAQQAAYEAQKATQQARAEVERAKGQAQAQQLVRATLTRDILQQKAIDKWDGHFPTYMGSGMLPFLNVTPNEK